MPARKGKFAVEIANLKAVRERFSTISKTIDFAEGSIANRIADNIKDAFRQAASFVRDTAISRADSSRVPRRLYSGSNPAIFAFTDFSASADRKRKRSALVGVRTGAPPRKDSKLYVEWLKGSRGMSLGRIFESGTKDRKVKPRRFFRGAIFATRGRVISILTEGYRAAVVKLNQLR